MITLDNRQDIKEVLSQYSVIGFDFDDVLFDGSFDRDFLKFIVNNPDKEYILITNRPSKYYDDTLRDLEGQISMFFDYHIDSKSLFSNIVMSPDHDIAGSDAVHHFKAKAAIEYGVEVMIDDDLVHSDGFENTNIDFIHVKLPQRRPTSYGGWF